MELPDQLSACSDEDLLARFIRGQAEAFGVLLRRYERELYGYLRRYLGDSTLAEDVFQNSFVQLYAKLDQYEIGRPVRPWLYTLATHQAIDALRRVGRHPTVSLDQTLSDTGEGELQSLLGMLEARGPSPLEVLQAEERRARVRAGVEKLPEIFREVVLLAYYQGLKYREIAEVLNVPVGTVKSRLHAALIRLQELWAGQPSLHEI